MKDQIEFLQNLLTKQKTDGEATDGTEEMIRVRQLVLKSLQPDMKEYIARRPTGPPLLVDAYLKRKKEETERARKESMLGQTIFEKRAETAKLKARIAELEALIKKGN